MERFVAQFTKYKIETRNKENRKIKLGFVISILFRVTFNLWNVCLLRLYQHDDHLECPGAGGVLRQRMSKVGDTSWLSNNWAETESTVWQTWNTTLSCFYRLYGQRLKKKNYSLPIKFSIENVPTLWTNFFLTFPWKSNSILACSFVSGHHSSSSCINKLDRDVEQEPGAGEWRGARHWEGRGVEEKEEVGTTGGDRRNLTSATKLDQLRVSLNQPRARRSGTINYGDMITYTITLCPHTQAGVSLWLVEIKI